MSDITITMVSELLMATQLDKSEPVVLRFRLAVKRRPFRAARMNTKDPTG